MGATWRQGRAVISRIWAWVGSVLMAVISVELVASAALAVLDPPRNEIDPRTQADAYAGAPWVTAYYQEFAASGQERWEPYVYWRRAAYQGTYINIGRDGIRATWGISGRKDLTIFMFGGSTMWGTGARDDYTIPSLVAKELSARGVAAHIVNFGESGWVTTQELIMLERSLQQGSRPDLVIFYDGANDAFSAFQSGVAGIPQNEFNRTREFNVLNPLRRSELNRTVVVDALRQTSIYRLASFVRSQTTPTRPNEELPTIPQKLIDDVVRVYSTNVRTAESLAEAYGFDVAFFLQPGIFTKPSLTPYERTRLESTNLRAYYSRVYEALRSDPALRGDARFHDVSDVFATDQRPYYLDEWHLSEDGNAAVARRVVEALTLPTLTGALRIPTTTSAAAASW